MSSISRQTAERLPARAFAFLKGVAASPAARNSLATAGYTQEEHQHACDLLMVIAGSGVKIAPTPTTTEASRAMAELNEADEPFFKRAEAVLRRHHPAQADFLFDNLAPVHGPDAFLGVAILLGRMDALESAPEREATRAEDTAAIAKLEARGITKAVRTHYAALVRTAQQVTPAAAEATIDPSADKRTQAIEALHKWYADWADTARAIIKRRDLLVTLGLAKRRKARKEETEAPPASEPSTKPTDALVSPFASVP